jgi:hypothetical protein
MFGIIGIIAIENMSKFNKKRQFTCLNSYHCTKVQKSLHLPVGNPVGNPIGNPIEIKPPE